MSCGMLGVLAADTRIIEKIVEAIGGFVKEGKVRNISLSNITTARRKAIDPTVLNI
jgi:aryl-alcohol dehydrogenase-like predicted oxidoreductase